ncbi:MAG TPA: TlpA disulfide reductase family protein [Burkholderiaceae bacterium]|nr:TlpA disulfide reductase family protein [Burkholderiaceae bacterium]
MNLVQLVRAARVLLCAGLAFFACAAVEAIAPAAAAPDFTLRTMNGPNLRLAEQRGRVVMVNFWATWCGPCRQEMPHLNRLYEKYRASGFVLLGVNVDDDTRNAAELATKLGLKFPVLLDTDKGVSKLYDLSTMPSTVLIDRDGKVRYVHRGYLTGYEDTYDKQIRELLK